MRAKRLIASTAVAVCAAGWVANKTGYLDRFYMPISSSYGVHFAKTSLGESTDTGYHADYPQFCIIPAYLRTKDGKGTDLDDKITFAHCNETQCIASIEPRIAEYRGKNYPINTPYRNGGSVAFCVTDMDHITIEAPDDTGLILDHDDRAIWETS